MCWATGARCAGLLVHGVLGYGQSGYQGTNCAKDQVKSRPVMHSQSALLAAERVYDPNIDEDKFWGCAMMRCIECSLQRRLNADFNADPMPISMLIQC